MLYEENLNSHLEQSSLCRRSRRVTISFKVMPRLKIRRHGIGIKYEKYFILEIRLDFKS